MQVLILGNSGSGKSTLAQALTEQHQLAHLDLDQVAWQTASPPIRRLLPDSFTLIDHHTTRHTRWVIEGCYADLAAHVLQQRPTLVLLDPPLDTCLRHARQRPWEPHKYPNPEEQQANLPMLLDWITEYPGRSDATGRQAHLELFHNYTGTRHLLASTEHFALPPD
ncbi:MAG: hypothetical protein RIG82_02845 [Phycisphaeraceae bacterium]